MPTRDPKTLSHMLTTLAVFYRENGRPLPWRTNTEPYPVWLSEIMLQQTRVEAVLPYFHRFLQTFPTVEDLAKAEDDLLFKCWEGLGYYSRARNLKKAALAIVQRGGFPTDYEGLVALPGVGDYTAGAIGSICFGLPTPAVDGNVLRVYARVFGVKEDVTAPAVKKTVRAALAEAYPTGRAAGEVTQGFMEIGQRFCSATGTPDCESCPLCPICHVSKTGEYTAIPYRAPKKGRRIEKRTVLLLYVKDENGIRFAIRKRPHEGLLADLWEFPGTEALLTAEDAFSHALAMGFAPEGAVETVSGIHIFSHVEWHMQGILLPCAAPSAPEGTLFVSPEEIQKNYPIASAFRVFKKLINEGEI